jgi:hypothetical protein
VRIPSSVGRHRVERHTVGAIVRSFFAIVLGAVVAGILIAVIEAASSFVHPLPPGVDPNDRAALREAMANIPVGALVIVLLAWAVGTFAGAWLAARLARRASVLHGMIVGVLLLVAGVANLIILPLWFWILGVAVFLPAAYLGARLAPRRDNQGRPAGPAPAWPTHRVV